jgi:hypothetical protein
MKSMFGQVNKLSVKQNQNSLGIVSIRDQTTEVITLQLVFLNTDD